MPTPTAVSYGTNRSRSPGATTRPGLAGLVRLLPTPRATDGTKGCPGQRGSHGDLTLPAAAVRVLPTPTATGGGPSPHRDGGPNLRTTVTHLPTDAGRWGGYATAITRWELALGRPVPEPVQPGAHGRPVLSPVFVEWLMGLPDGWVTSLGLPRTTALRVLGNGVVPQQAAAALRLLWCPPPPAMPARRRVHQ